MESLLLEYLPILIFIGLAAILGGALIVLPLVLAPSKPDPEKLSAYECGFPAFGDARMKFDVRFYLVAILFIIFDLEVAFLFPWAITLTKLGGDTAIFRIEEDGVKLKNGSQVAAVLAPPSAAFRLLSPILPTYRDFPVFPRRIFR